MQTAADPVAAKVAVRVVICAGAVEGEGERGVKDVDLWVGGTAPGGELAGEEVELPGGA